MTRRHAARHPVDARDRERRIRDTRERARLLRIAYNENHPRWEDAVGLLLGIRADRAAVRWSRMGEVSNVSV